MTHLSREELIRWRDEGADVDRERVLAHLAACESCRRELSTLVRHATPSALDPATFVARGLDAYPGPPRARWKRPALWAVTTLAAAAALFIALRPERSTPVAPASDVRSSELVALAPAGDVDRVVAFRWASPFAVNRYEVVVRDARGATVLQRVSSGSELDLSGDTSSTLPPGTYTWTVHAFDSTGREIAASPVQAFRVR